MTIQLVVENVIIPIKKISFSDGSSSIKLEIPEGFNPSAYYSISVDPTTKADDYLWEILLVLDAVERTFGDIFKRNYLVLPYLPHARADRVFEYGNGLPLDLFLSYISREFTNISLIDPHSDYYKRFETFEKFEVKPQHRCFWETVRFQIQGGDVLVAPDKGALNKIYLLQDALKTRGIQVGVTEAGKKRDIETGRVLETTLPDGTDLTGKACWIVDDLSDGNGTFIPLAKKLKEVGAKQVNMYVTHLIAAKGLNNIFGIVDKLFAYQTVGNYITKQDVTNFNAGIEPRKF